MANVKQQADNCLDLFRGNPQSTIQRAINSLSSGVVNELCSRFNCTKDNLAQEIANS